MHPDLVPGSGSNGRLPTRARRLPGPFSGRGWRIERLRRELGAQGPRRLLIELLAATVYRRVLLIERTLLEPVPEVQARVDVQFGLLDKAGVEEYFAFLPHARRPQIERSLEDGHLCFVARRQGDIVAVCWASTSPVWTEYLGVTIPVSPEHVYTYGLITQPALRGMDIAPALKAHMMDRFRQLGYQRMFAAVEPENWASLRANEKLGYRTYGRILSYRLGPWRRCVLRRGERSQAL